MKKPMPLAVDALFYESDEDALKVVVLALGGPKKTGIACGRD
jgi:hypothetical protein